MLRAAEKAQRIRALPEAELNKLLAEACGSVA
jgi:hypothetical protein